MSTNPGQWIVSDTLFFNRRFRTLNILDDYNRESFYIEIPTDFPAKRVIIVLEEVISWRCLPEVIRVDNGPEFIFLALKEWWSSMGRDLQYSQPDKPVQNAYIERLTKLTGKKSLTDTCFTTWIKSGNLQETGWLIVMETGPTIGWEICLPGNSPAGVGR